MTERGSQHHMSEDLNASPFGHGPDPKHWLYRLHELLTLPFAIHFLLSSPRIDPSYNLTTWRRFRLGLRMYRNTRRIWTGISYRAHLAMAVKLWEVPPTQRGVVVECGCFRGGTTANLSLACAAVGRELYVYDSFEGLPPAEDGDVFANPDGAGWLNAQLDQVKAHVERHGAPEVCTYVKGWFSDTTPHHEPPIVLLFLDVDYQSSLTDCILNLWPKLVPRGLCFIDEYIFNDYCALFWSERFWSEHFDRTPPGLMGSGTGISLGGFYMGG
ncbi:MAG: TylF/MycF/NovP-related O-methyltransferase, partial [Acidimicrobiales bacterium]